MIAEDIYRLGPRDEASALLEGVVQVQSILSPNAGALQHVHSFFLPNDRAFLLTHAAIIASRISPTSVESMGMRVDTLTETVSQLFNATGLQITVGSDWAISRDFTGILIPPSSILRILVNFSLNQISNATTASISGVLIPRGNLAFTRFLAQRDPPT